MNDAQGPAACARLLRRKPAAPIVLVLLPVLGSALAADQHAVAPRGEYAAVDVRLANEAIAALRGASNAERARAIEAVLAAPQKYAPPVLYELAHALFAVDRKDDAAFWFYAGQLRGRFDANRCADVSARQAVAVLNDEFGTEINQYTFKHLAKLEALIPKVVEWDRKAPHDYDHRWINLHGMAAMIESLDPKGGKPAPLSLPRAQWNAIAEKTRTDYLEGFTAALAIARRRSASPTVSAPPSWERHLPGAWQEVRTWKLPVIPKELGAKPSEKERATAADEMLMQWTITADTIAVVNPLIDAARRTPPYGYRIVKVDGNVVTLELTAPGGPPFQWDLEYLGPDLLRVLDRTREVYRLARVAAP